MAACSGAGCSKATWGNRAYCTDCAKLRVQHTSSHTIEGHSKPIKMCPVCESIFGA